MPTPEQELEAAMDEIAAGAYQEGRWRDVLVERGRLWPHEESALSEAIAQQQSAKSRIVALFAARDCGHPEAHCPVCQGSADACRETLRP